MMNESRLHDGSFSVLTEKYPETAPKALYYILDEYDYSPNEFVHDFENGMKLLETACSISNESIMHKEIDDFFCDEYQRRRKSYIYTKVL